MFKFPGKGPAHLSVSMTHNSRHFYQGLSAKILTRTSLQEETDKPSFVKWFTKNSKNSVPYFRLKTLSYEAEVRVTQRHILTILVIN